MQMFVNIAEGILTHGEVDKQSVRNAERNNNMKSLITLFKKVIEFYSSNI